MKEKYAVKTLIDNIDHQLLDTTYKTDETETKAIENQIEEIKKHMVVMIKYLNK